MFSELSVTGKPCNDTDFPPGASLSGSMTINLDACAGRLPKSAQPPCQNPPRNENPPPSGTAGTPYRAFCAPASWARRAGDFWSSLRGPMGSVEMTMASM